MTPEGKVKNLVRRGLEQLSAHYRFMPVQNGMGAPGLDFYCCIDGLFVAIETKVEGKALTPRQRETAKSIAMAGGLVFVIRNADDVTQMIARIHIWRKFAGLQAHGSRAGVIYDNTMGD